MQLGLFGIQEEIKPDKVSWSHSKREMLRQCPRKYYYQYYGANKKHAPDQPYKDRLAFLKTVGNKYLLQGDVVHTIIATYFNKIKKLDEEWNLEKCIGWANSLIQESITYSDKVKNGVSYNKQYLPPLLKEIYNGDGTETPDLIIECQNKVHQNLENFFGSEKFENLKRGGKTLSSIIEGKAKFVINDFIKVDGVIDIAFEDDSSLIIADWKTGKNAEEDTSLQLLTYALWAIEKKGIALKNIKIQKAYLHEDTLEELEFSDRNLLRAKSRIIQDAELMKQMDSFAKEGIFDAFEKCNQQRVCNLCQFQEVCIKN